MTTFLRLLADKGKDTHLLAACSALRAGSVDDRVFQVAPESFRVVPGAPFSYWVSDAVRNLFKVFPGLESNGRVARRTNGTTDDGRWIRATWEISRRYTGSSVTWVPHAKGGSFSQYYADVHLVIAWNSQAQTYPGYMGTEHRPDIRPASLEYFFSPGLTWPRRTNGLSFRALPKGCIFGDKGPGIFVANDSYEELQSLLSITNSRPFQYLVSLQLARTELAQSYEAGLIQQTPVPNLSSDQQAKLTALARSAWSHKRSLDTIEETSHAFLLPGALRARLGDYDPPSIESKLMLIQAEIDAIAFELYDFSKADRIAARMSTTPADEGTEKKHSDDEEDEDESAAPINQTVGVLSWAVGVAFGRFDWRLATGERKAPPEPAPFDPLPVKSPGMLVDGTEPFHAHPGILVDDPGHEHDLVRLVEEVLLRVNAPVPSDVRRWLQRDLFPFHLQRYSRSRRKAPIYWPLSTRSGDYTLWIYYPSLTSQTLYTAVNDFIDGPNGKLTLVRRDADNLRQKGSDRSREDDRALETLQSLEEELIELRDTLLKIAPTYHPSQDDGVQITAAPLWPLFRHRPWQKLLKETWGKLEGGDYMWAHLALAYWPDRVREKCKTDKSLAIAHDLEHLYVEPELTAPKTRGRKKKG